MRLSSMTQTNRLSLRRMALWLPILGVVLLMGTTLVLSMVSLSVIQVAEKGGKTPRPR